MKTFMSDGYLLTTPAAERLYSAVRDLPIFDYHCHLVPEEIHSDRRFFNLTELWLAADHYKWRVMRQAGVPERLVTGDAPAREKFDAFAAALPEFVGNPVYHWAHLELKKYFGITLPLSPATADEIWNATERAMADGSFSARRLIECSGVRAVVTTDDPVDDLAFHEKLAAENLSFSVLPCFRPDKAINIEKDGFAEYIAALGKAVGRKINCVDDVVAALADRLDFFVAHGAPAADLSFKNFAGRGDRAAAETALAKRLAGQTPDGRECGEYAFAVTEALARLFRERGIVMQIHTGVLRNQNGKRFEAIGADCGIDSVGDALDIEAAGRLFDAIERDGGMPKTIVYTLNAPSYYPLATMLGNFAGDTRGKLQLGAAWWFMDHRDGIREQLKTFASTGGLGYFNGMLTDSRSFVSYARHDYFRRILCSVLGEWAEAGECPDDGSLVETARNICYFNAEKFFAAGGNVR